MFSLDELENILLFKRNLELLQPCQVLILECSSPMMLFLVSNVANDRVQLRMTVGERAIAFLPTEPSANPLFLVDEVRRVCFDISNEIRQSHNRLQSDQYVNVIGHSVDGDQLLFAVSHDPGDVLVQLFFEFPVGLARDGHQPRIRFECRFASRCLQ